MSKTSNSPIILVGAARSGTKFARSVLAASSQVAAIPYDVNYIWRYGNEWLEHDELDAATVTPKMRAHIRKQLDRLAGITPSNNLTLVEKTVGSTLRVPFIEAIYPNARYIHLIRDGRAVTESAMRLWQAPPDTGSLLTKLRRMPLSSIGYVAWFGYNFIKGLVFGRGGGQIWGPRYKGVLQDVAKERPLVEICARQWQCSVEKAQKGLKQIPSERVFTLRYNDLVGNEERIREMIAFAELDDEEQILAHYRATVRSDTDEKWQKNMRKEDIAAMLEILTPTLEEQGFMTPDKAVPSDKGAVS